MIGMARINTSWDVVGFRPQAGGAPATGLLYTHGACQQRGFTLLEMLAVVVVVGVLLGLVTPMVNHARKGARQADCRSNLRQFGMALTVYRAEHNGANPPWLSSMFPKYIDTRAVYLCKSDRFRGEGAIIPQALQQRVSEFPETIDNRSASPRHPLQNRDVGANSYFYEFSAADCSWRPGMSWSQAKEEQLRFGDAANGGSRENPVPYSTSRMPIIRCWHHYAESKTSGVVRSPTGSRGTRISNAEPLTLNVAYAGNVFVAPPWWEGRLEPGETR